MQYTLTTTSTGELAIRSASKFVPPLGLVIPAKQTVRAVIPSTKTFGTLFSEESPALPTGFQIQPYNGDVYALGGGDWINEVTGQPANNDSVSGTIHITNPAIYDIGVSW